MTSFSPSDPATAEGPRRRLILLEFPRTSARRITSYVKKVLISDLTLATTKATEQSGDE